MQFVACLGKFEFDIWIYNVDKKSDIHELEELGKGGLSKVALLKTFEGE